jgi:hypothetical protein
MDSRSISIVGFFFPHFLVVFASVGPFPLLVTDLPSRCRFGSVDAEEGNDETIARMDVHFDPVAQLTTHMSVSGHGTAQPWPSSRGAACATTAEKTVHSRPFWGFPPVLLGRA